MLRRSQSAADAAALKLVQQSRRNTSLTARPKYKPEYQDPSKIKQGISAHEHFQSKHGYAPRPQQVDSLVDVLNGRTTFLLAGTGFGKSRVPEMFYHAHDTEKYAPIILSINPLDSLGDDQVRRI
ncbi:hypothetical protein DFH28DRAFT_866823, partial [Melampsora americana]